MPHNPTDDQYHWNRRRGNSGSSSNDDNNNNSAAAPTTPATTTTTTTTAGAWRDDTRSQLDSLGTGGESSPHSVAQGPDATLKPPPCRTSGPAEEVRARYEDGSVSPEAPTTVMGPASPYLGQTATLWNTFTVEVDIVAINTQQKVDAGVYRDCVRGYGAGCLGYLRWQRAQMKTKRVFFQDGERACEFWGFRKQRNKLLEQAMFPPPSIPPGEMCLLSTKTAYPRSAAVERLFSQGRTS
ncbi:hypothetical protein GWK47_004699 [Chionoecetes opilio]|uniref:Uncharacterized protein n=1 Tax=Chionoecetes opilio TaxID=41210 RepID=A0A8J5CY44_CHIOP|nr:hypothetical protein GWK47_004699 [Chionoecetes opilio]